jgi:hypothetical protein
MSTFRTSVIVTAPASGAAFCLIRPTGLNRPRIKRVKLVATTAVQSFVGFFRLPFANFGTPSITVVPQPLTTLDGVALTGIDTAWSVPPTLPGSVVPHERSCIAGVIGNGEIVDFTDAMGLDPGNTGNGLLLWNTGVAAAAALQISLTVEE